MNSPPVAPSQRPAEADFYAALASETPCLATAFVISSSSKSVRLAVWWNCVDARSTYGENQGNWAALKMLALPARMDLAQNGSPPALRLNRKGPSIGFGMRSRETERTFARPGGSNDAQWN